MGLLGFLFDRAPLPSASPLDDGPPAAEAGTLPAGPTRYNVYREIAPPPDAGNAAAKTPAASPPVPVNPMPIEGFTFKDPLGVMTAVVAVMRCQRFAEPAREQWKVTRRCLRA